MNRRWIVTALGQDRPGIVAGVTQVLYQLGCNLEDSAMTRLEGEFAIMLIFTTQPSTDEADLRRAFVPVEKRLRLAVHLKPLTRLESRSPRSQAARFLLSVYGADRPGIVFRISDFLARARVNITDVHTHRSTGKGPSLYLMLLEIELQTRSRSSALERSLKRLAKQLHVAVSLRPADARVL